MRDFPFGSFLASLETEGFRPSVRDYDRIGFALQTGETISIPREQSSLAPIVFITSNSERRLPEPFLRRCVYHHIAFDDELAERAVFSRRDQYSSLSDDFLRMALQRFLALRDEPLRKRPATSELLVWLRVLSLAVGTYPERLEESLSKLPYLETLLKDRQDLARIDDSR